MEDSFDLVAARGLILAASLSYLVLAGHYFFRLPLLGPFVAPSAALAMVLHFFVSSPATFLAFHIAGATMGQVLALAAGLVSVLYLWGHRALKRKLLGPLPPRLPALDLLEKVLLTSLWSGFLFLTAALVSGMIYFKLYSLQLSVEFVQKIAWALSVWFWYLSILLARSTFGIPIKRVAQMSLIGFALLAVTFFGFIFFRGGSGVGLG